MPRRAQELPLRRAASRALIFVTLLSCPFDLRGQEPDSSSTSVQGFIEVAPRLTRVFGQTSPFVSVAALLGFPGSWRAGGAGYFSLEQVNLGAPPPLQDFELNFGYGGLLLERSIPISGAVGDDRPRGLFARLLTGGGNAEVRNAASGSRIRSDNFLVMEPALGFQTPLSGWASAGITAAYRLVIGVDGLQDIEEENLRGGSIGLFVVFGPF